MGTVAPLVWGLVAVAMPISLLLARRYHARQEANVKMAVQEANTKLAMLYSPTCTPWLSDRLLAPDALEIGSNHTLWHTLQGTWEGHEQIVAWHCWWRSPRAGYGDDSARYSRIINVFPDAFPKNLRFSLTPNAFPGQAIRRKTVESPLKCHADERFAANYRLSNAENDAVRELFSKNVIEWFANHPGWIVKCSNGVFLTAFDSWKSIKQISKKLSAEMHPNPTCQSIVDLAESSREILALMRTR